MDVKKLLGTAAVMAGLGASAAMGMPERATAEGAMASTRLEVDISEREMYLYHGGEIVNTYTIAVGESQYPTPKGDFSIDRIIWNPAWVPPPNTEWGQKHEKKDPNEEGNPMVGAKLFFEYPDYYIHGTDAPHTLGEAESHGCIRMAPSEVMDLARWVQEHGGEPRDEGWFSWVKKNDESKHEITLPNSIPIDIHE